MGRMDIHWDELEKRPPIDNIIVALGVIVHNVLSYPVYRERRRIENQESEAVNGNGKYLTFLLNFKLFKVYVHL